MCSVPQRHRLCLLRACSQMGAAGVPRTWGTSQSRGRISVRSCREQAGDAPGSQGDIQGQGLLQGWRRRWQLWERPGAAHPTVGAPTRRHTENPRMQRNPQHAVCVRSLPVTMCRPDPRELAPTEVPQRPLALLGRGARLSRAPCCPPSWAASPVPRAVCLFHVQHRECPCPQTSYPTGVPCPESW